MPYKSLERCDKCQYRSGADCTAFGKPKSGGNPKTSDVINNKGINCPDPIKTRRSR